MRMKGVFTALLAGMLWSCSGSDGKTGATGATGQDGAPGAPGAPGTPGSSSLSTGVNVTINSVTVAADATVTVDFKMLDDQGSPVDSKGVYSLGTAMPRFGLGNLGANGAQYVSLIKSSRGSPTMLNTASAGNGTLTESSPRSGQYTYVFPKTPASGSIDLSGIVGSTLTHTAFIVVSRQTDPLDSSTLYVANVSRDFVPAGGITTMAARSVASTSACNQCHDPLAMHPDNHRYRDVKQCGLCHTPDLGAELDLPHFVHAIHSSQNLVASGLDFREVTYPKSLGDCTACHDSSSGAINAAQYKSNPTAAACTGCHTYLKFDGSASSDCVAGNGWDNVPSNAPGNECNHIMAQQATSKCATCHDSANIDVLHSPAIYWNYQNNPKDDPAGAKPSKNPIVTTRIDAVTFEHTDAGYVPTFKFTVWTSYDGGQAKPRNLITNPMQTFRFTYGMSAAGASTVEYVRNGSFRVPTPQGKNSGWMGVDPPLPVSTGVDGQYTWTPAAGSVLPATDCLVTTESGSCAGGAYTGADSVAFEIETAEADEYFYSANSGIEIKGITSDVFFSRLDNSSTVKPLTRRVIVDGAKCLACHNETQISDNVVKTANLPGGAPFGFHHAGSRNNVQGCSFCHNAVTTNGTGYIPTPVAVGTVDQSLQLSVMIHRIHTGRDSADGSWVYYGRGGALERVTYPGNRLDCAQCHVTPSNPATSVWGLPLNDAVYPTTKTTVYKSTGWETTQIPRTTAACGSCHDTMSAKSHMQQNSVGGEACDSCHASGKVADVRQLHVKTP